MGSTFREGDLPRGLAGVEYWTRRRVDFRLSGSTGGFGRTVSAGPWCPQLAKGAGFRMRCCRSPALRKKLRSGATADRHAKKTNPSSRSWETEADKTFDRVQGRHGPTGRKSSLATERGGSGQPHLKKRARLYEGISGGADRNTQDRSATTSTGN